MHAAFVVMYNIKYKNKVLTFKYLEYLKNPALDSALLVTNAVHVHRLLAECYHLVRVL